MYCDGMCNWYEPAVLIPAGAFFGVILIVAYGIYRLARRLQRRGGWGA